MRKLVFIISIFIVSCTSEAAKKKIIVNRMTEDICSMLGEQFNMSGAGAQTGVFNELLSQLGEKVSEESLGYCNCIKDIIGKSLLEKFTLKELEDIERDPIKQLMILSKITEQEAIQAQVLQCLEEGVQNVVGEYEDFNQKLEEKYDK